MPDIMDVKDIAFPNLGIYFEGLPRSFTIFGFEIAFYGLIIGIGVVLGVLMAVHIAKWEQMDPDIIWDFAIYAVLFSVIGARIYYVVFSWDMYKNNLLSIFNGDLWWCDWCVCYIIYLLQDKEAFTLSDWGLWCVWTSVRTDYWPLGKFL